MKIGIVTIVGDFNYGNRLQNYALEQILLSKGIEIQTIKFTKTLSLTQKFKNIAKKLILNKLDEKRRLHLKMVQYKEKKICPFTEKYLNTVDHRKVDLNSFDLFFVGSDQVWNPNYIRNDSNFFLEFAQSEKRFSYAASFGVSEISNEFHNDYSKYLSKMNSISVREEAGVEIVETLTNKKAILVPDPTMLLTKEDWEELIESQALISPEISKNQKPYILLYLLRGCSEEKRKCIEEFASKRNYNIVELMGDFFDERHTIMNPIEFLEAVLNAEMVFTDSFHCGIFSIIFHSPFVVFERNDGGGMVSRIRTLLKRFGFDDNLYYENMDLEIIKDSMNFSKVNFILEEWRKIGLDFIEECLKKVRD